MTASYDFHGVTIAVESEDPNLAAAIDARLIHFRSDMSSVDVRVRYHFLAAGEADVVHRPAAGGRLVYEPPAGRVLYYPNEDVLLIEFDGRVRVGCRPAEGRIDVSVRPGGRDLWLLSRPLLTFALIETLKRRGLHSVHASAVAKEGRCVVLTGSSGSGKTTLAVALARRGFDLVSDDMVFLRRDATRILGFPDELDVSEHTVEMLPELAPVSVREEGWRKLRVRPEAVCSVAAEPTEPSLLIFLGLGQDGKSALEPITDVHALRELAPNVLLTDPPASQEHLTALGALVEHSCCYSLEVGRDFGRLAAEVASVLEASRSCRGSAAAGGPAS